MNSLIENLNLWGADLGAFAWPMLWQSSLLIALVFAFDLLLARKIRAAVRYALWLPVLVKLLLPPALALPTGAAWWLLQAPTPPVPVLPKFTVTYDDAPVQPFPAADFASLPVPPPPQLEWPGYALILSAVISAGLLLWLAVRWWQVARMVRRAVPAEKFSRPLAEALCLAGTPGCGPTDAQNGASKYKLKMVADTMSPAVCGLIRPVILLPQALAEKLSPAQLRAVLLHEVIHLRRGDVWVNCAQALLQIVYWWHPLLWVANARIRRVREEAVDDAVMLALHEEADGYAPTLLEVAKLAFRRPLLSLGLVGIMESRSALRQRIERLVNFRAPRRAGLTLASLFGIVVFSAVALPMGEAPAPAPTSPPVEAMAEPAQIPPAASPAGDTSLTLTVNPAVFIRNVKAQAGATLHTTGDSCMDILADILRRENVDCSPPHNLAFNTNSGDITTENSPAALAVIQQVILQLNREDGNCGLPLKPAAHLRQVLISGEFYALTAADFSKLVAQTGGAKSVVIKSFAGTIAADHAADFDQKLAALKLKPFQKPRVQTSHGMLAEFFVGESMAKGAVLDGVDFDCLPYIGDRVVDLAFHIDVTGDLTANGPVHGAGKWTFSSRNLIEDQGRLIVCANNPDGSFKTNLVAVLRVQILTNQPAAHFRQRLVETVNATNPTPSGMQPAGGAETPPPATAGGPKILTMTFKVNTAISQALLQQALLDAGVKMPPLIFLYFNGDTFPVRGTAEQLALVNGAVLKLNGYSKNEIAANQAGFARQLSLITAATQDGTNLFTKTYKIDAKLLLSGVASMNGGTVATADSPAQIPAVARELFAKLGVNWHTPPGKAVYYSESDGLLFLRATAMDFAVIDQTISALVNSAPAATPSPGSAAAVGPSGGSASVGIEKSLLEQVAADITNGTEAIVDAPPQIHIKARFLEVPKGTTAGFGSSLNLTNSPAGAFTGMLDAAKLKTVLHSLESLKGVQIMGQLEVTTMTGRQCQLRATQTIIVVTNFALVDNAVSPEMEPVETGPMLDVVPYALSDGYTINLAVIPTLTEFRGYDAPAKTNLSGADKPIQLPVIRPDFTVRQVVVSANVLDNQTMVVAGLQEKYFVGGVPETGSAGWPANINESAAKLIRDKPKSSDNELLVFVTATLVDPAGNRVHADN